jgi:hypothetical protein
MGKQYWTEEDLVKGIVLRQGLKLYKSIETQKCYELEYSDHTNEGILNIHERDLYRLRNWLNGIEHLSNEVIN